MNSRLPASFGYPITLVAGAFAGWIDLNNLSIMPTALVLFTAGGSLSFLWPRHVVFWIMLLGVCIPLFHTIARSFAFSTLYLAQPNSWDFLLTFLPPSVGASLGIFAAFLSGNRFSESET